MIKYVLVLLTIFFIPGFTSAFQIQDKISSLSPSSPEPFGAPSQKFEYRGKVTSIIDGDTLEVNGRRIRLALVNTPERNEQISIIEGNYRTASSVVGVGHFIIT